MILYIFFFSSIKELKVSWCKLKMVLQLVLKPKVIKHIMLIEHIERVVKHMIVKRMVIKHIGLIVIGLVIRQRVIKQLSGQQLIVFKRVDIERVIQLFLKRHIQLLGH